jgi:hypothetical protein
MATGQHKAMTKTTFEPDLVCNAPLKRKERAQLMLQNQPFQSQFLSKSLEDPFPFLSN